MVNANIQFNDTSLRKEKFVSNLERQYRRGNLIRVMSRIFYKPKLIDLRPGGMQSNRGQHF